MDRISKIVFSFRIKAGSFVLEKACRIYEDVAFVGKDLASSSNYFECIFLSLVVPPRGLHTMIELDESFKTVLCGDFLKIFLNLVGTGITVAR